MGFLYFVGYTCLFAVVFLSALAVDWQIFAILAAAAVVAALWVLIQKLGGIEKKLDELLREKKE